MGLRCSASLLWLELELVMDGDKLLGQQCSLLHVEWRSK